MNIKGINFSDQEIRVLYKMGSNESKQMLEGKLGKDFFSQSAIERIRTYEDACAELGEKPIDEDACQRLGLNKNDIAYIKLTRIVKALNEGWVAKIYDNEDRWIPWFYHNQKPADFAYDQSIRVYNGADAGSSSRLCFKTNKLAHYAGKQFIELWREFID